MTELQRLTDVEAREKITLPSVIIVLSADGREWTKDWGAKEFIHGKSDVPGTQEIFNLNHITFGPYEPTWLMPHYMSLLNNRAQQIVPWLEIENLRWWKFFTPGDTLNFPPQSIRFTLEFAHGHTPPPPESSTLQLLKRLTGF